MIKNKEFENKIQKKWGNIHEDWLKDFKELLYNVKDNKIMFRTYTPDFNDGDPCTTSYLIISGSSYFDADNNFIYQILDTNEIVAASLEHDDYDYNNGDSLEYLHNSRIVSIDYLIENNYIEPEAAILIKEFKAKNIEFKNNGSSFYEDYSAYKTYCNNISSKLNLPNSIVEFIKLRVEKINDCINDFGCFYLSNGKIKISADYVS